MKVRDISRTNALHWSGIITAVLFYVVEKYAPGKVPVEVVAAAASGLFMIFSALGMMLKADDRKKIAAFKDQVAETIARIGAFEIHEVGCSVLSGNCTCGVGSKDVSVHEKVDGAVIRRKATAGELLKVKDILDSKGIDSKAAKAAAKVGLGLLLLAGCQPHWELCEVDLSDHPSKPRPAASARVRCSRTVLCNHADGAVCDGKKLAEVSK